VALLRRGEHVARARRQLQDMDADLLAAGAEAGAIRSDIAPGELAGYCLHALAAADSLPSAAAVRRLLASPCPACARGLPFSGGMPSVTFSGRRRA